MDFGINFNALQPVDAVGSYMRGREAKSQIDAQAQAKAREEAMRKAYSTYEQDPEGAVQSLMAIDPKAGMELKAQITQEAQVKARQGALGAAAGGDLPGAQKQALQAGDLDLYKQISEMTKEQRAAKAAQAEEFASIAFALKKYPMEKRIDVFKSIMPELEQKGYKPDALNQTLNHLDDQSIDLAIAQASSLKDQIAQFNTDRTFGETQRHNKATEGLSAGNLAVSRGNLGLRREEHQARLKQGGYGASEDLSGMSTADLMAAAGLSPPGK